MRFSTIFSPSRTVRGQPPATSPNVYGCLALKMNKKSNILRPPWICWKKTICFKVKVICFWWKAYFIVSKFEQKEHYSTCFWWASKALQCMRYSFVGAMVRYTLLQSSAGAITITIPSLNVVWNRQPVEEKKNGNRITNFGKRFVC